MEHDGWQRGKGDSLEPQGCLRDKHSNIQWLTNVSTRFTRCIVLQVVLVSNYTQVGPCAWRCTLHMHGTIASASRRKQGPENAPPHARRPVTLLAAPAHATLLLPRVNTPRTLNPYCEHTSLQAQDEGFSMVVSAHLFLPCRGPWTCLAAFSNVLGHFFRRANCWRTSGPLRLEPC